jgi:hypothetical protein
MRLVWLFIVMALLAGCGGGSGSSGTPGGGIMIPEQPSAAVVEFSTVGGSADTVVYGIDMIVHLPAGVTVSADPATGEVSVDVLKSTVSGAMIGAKYVAATSTAPAYLKVNVASGTGFPQGKFATLTCKVAPGTKVGTASFTIDPFSAWGVAADNSTVRLDAVRPLVTAQTQ